MTPPHELVRRIADVLRADVAPATDGSFPRSQAFRASAVLRRVARGLELADAHAAAEAGDRRRLAEDPLLTAVDVHGALAPLGSPRSARSTAPNVAAAVAALADAEDHKAALARLVAALYDDRDRVPEFERVLARVRQALRADLDRDLDVAR